MARFIFEAIVIVITFEAKVIKINYTQTQLPIIRQLKP